MAKTALIVDDSRSLRQMVRDTLEGAGYCVEESANGQDALAVADQRAIDFVITDVNMPVMDGISFVQQLRSRKAFRFTPVLILTTESTAAVKDQGRRAGATGWMVKPFRPAQLLDVVAKIVS